MIVGSRALIGKQVASCSSDKLLTVNRAISI